MKVVLENLTKRFPGRGKKKGEVIAANNLSFEIPDGKLIGLLGPSGCGKSTTLNLLSGLLKPSSGKIFFGDDEVTNLPAEKRGVGVVFQSYALYPHLTVEQNILFPLENLRGKEKLSREEMREKALEAARLVQIDELMDRKPSELSGGQQQRVALARAFVVEPSVLLMDEPLSNLDAKLRVQMRSIIKKLQRRLGITTIYVTHDQEEALAISDRIAVMNQGRVMQVGTPSEIYAKPENPFVAGFIGVSNFLNCEVTRCEGDMAKVSIKGELDIDVPVRKPYTGKAKLSARPEQLFFSETGMPGKVMFSTFLGDFIEYEVELFDGQTLIINEYTKDTAKVHEVGEKVFISFDATRISLYNEAEEVLSK